VIAYVLYTLFIISCFILILVVLLQPGKGDAASALGGGVSGAAFGPRGTTTLLAKVTVGAAFAFMAIAFALSIPGLVVNRSVTAGMPTPEGTPTTEQPAAPAPDNGAAPTQAPSGAIPAGQLTIDENGQLKADVPATGNQAPAAQPEAKPEGKSETKPEAKPETKTETKKPEAATKKSGGQ